MRLAQTPPERLVDRRGRPYFLWDMDFSLAVFETRILDPDPEVRAYLIGKLMRQAKPDDVFQFVTLEAVRQLWPRLLRHLGQSRPFWIWLMETWNRQAHAGR